ncbi:putative phage protein (TIGR02218 family) [Sphingomonas sp. BK580]|nr:putative phage protein (TIGR02218 family) [Sphingomonas sp. BK580]
MMMAARRRFARVVAAEGTALTLDAAEPVAGAYAGGVLRWFDGGNAGLISGVAGSAGTGVTLEEAPPHAVAADALVELVEGCDKRLATCAARFDNSVNFRGEPYVPGNDLLTRYPGA